LSPGAENLVEATGAASRYKVCKWPVISQGTEML